MFKRKLTSLSLALLVACAAPSSFAQGPEEGLPPDDDPAQKPETAPQEPAEEPPGRRAPDGEVPPRDDSSAATGEGEETEEPDPEASDEDAPATPGPAERPEAEDPPASNDPTEQEPREGDEDVTASGEAEASPEGGAPAADDDRTEGSRGDDSASDDQQEADSPEQPPGQDVVVVVGAGGGPSTEPAAADDSDEAGAASDSGQEVIVAGTRSAQMAGAVQVIGEEELERAEYDDPHAVLRQVPGVFVREEEGTGLRPNIAMRGVNPDRSKKVTLMEDGILFGPAPYSAPAAYYFPLMTRMTQVRVIKGPGAIAFGPQTVAGAIDVITRRVPMKPTLFGDVSYGEYGYRKVHAYAGTSNEQFGVLLEGVHIGNDGFKQLESDENTGAARNEWMAKAFYLIDPSAAVSHELSAKLSYSEEASNETYLGLTDEDFEENPNWRYPASELDRMDNHRTSLALTHEMQSFEQNLDVRTTLYRNDFFRVWRKFNRLGGASASSVLANPDDPEYAAHYGVLTGQTNTAGPLDTIYVGPNQREYVSQGISSRLLWKPSGRVIRHKLEAGLRLHHDAIEREHSEDGFAMFDGELYPVDEATIQTASNRASTHALAMHVTDAITWRSLTVTPGVRFEGLVSNFEDFLTDEQSTRVVGAVMPGLGVYYGLTNAWGVLAGAYRGFSPPAPGTDESVKPEQSINYEAGTRYSDNGTRAEVIGFFNDYSNLTDVCTFSSGCLDEDLDRQFDAGRANIYGLEVAAAHDLEVGDITFPLSMAYTLSMGEFRSDFASADPIYGDVTSGDEVPYLPRHQANATAGFEVGRVSAYTIFNYVAATRELAGSEPLSEVMSTDPLVTFDAGLSLQAEEYLKVYVNGRNMADYRAIVAHRPFGARPNAPRWIQAGVKAEF